ncbi:hypothetical protein D3C80_2096010 [compost metagenome]
MARRTPVSTWPITPGTITLHNVSQRVALKLRLSCNQRGSSWRTPAAVLSRIGHSAAKASRK